MSERWRRFIESGIEAGGGLIPAGLSQWAFLAPVVECIRRAAPPGARLLDVGCGAGVFPAFLAHHGWQVVGIDDDPDIVAYAVRTQQELRSAARIEQASAFDLSRFHGQFDLVYSLGVVEHFDRDVTVRLIAEQARCAPHVLVVVPTRYTRYTGPVTDERLYRRGQVARIVRDAGCDVRECFVFGAIPSWPAIQCGRLLPPVLLRLVRHLFTYGMGIACLGVRR